MKKALWSWGIVVDVEEIEGNVVILIAVLDSTYVVSILVGDQVGSQTP
jgi:hypothetical protein